MNISKKRLALFILIAFFVGGLSGTSGQKTETVTVEIFKNEIEWKDLKQLDEKIFLNLYEEVSATILNDNSRLEKLDEEYIFLQSERDLILEKLGY